MRNGLTAALLLCGAMCLAGFDRPAEPGDASILDHTKWRLTKVTKTELAIPAAAKFTVTFESSQYMFSGCNLISGKFRLEAGKLIATGPGRSTMKACPPEIQEVDGAFVKMLTSKPTVHLEGDQLALAADDGGQWTFHREPMPPSKPRPNSSTSQRLPRTAPGWPEGVSAGSRVQGSPWTVSHARYSRGLNMCLASSIGCESRRIKYPIERQTLRPWFGIWTWLSNRPWWIEKRPTNTRPRRSSRPTDLLPQHHHINRYE